MKFNIDGYENMTPEEKIAALEAYEPDMSGFVAKSVFDKKSSEAAELSRQLKSRMTEDEAQKAKEAEEREALLARVKELEHKETVGNYTAAYLGLGYDEKLARATAEALAKGDMDAVFANQKNHIEGREKALRTELLKQTPPPPAGGATGGMKKEEFAKMSLAEKQKFATENPETYKSFYE